MSGIWKSAYEVIRFTDYSFFNYDDYNNIIWLKNKKKQSVMLINPEPLSEERRKLLSDNIFNRHHEFSRMAGFNIKSIRSYYKAAEPFKEKYKDDRLKIVHKGMNSFSSLINHPFYKMEMNQPSSKNDEYYAKKVMSNHPLETHLTKYTPMTYLLLAVNLVIFLLNLFYLYIQSSLQVTDDLAVSYHAVANGDYYRLLTSTFLHSGMEHFLFNVTALFVLGKFVESLYSKWHLLAAYVLTGTLASLFSLMFLQDAISLGASGAIYGLLGIIIIHLLLNKKLDYKLLVQVALIFIVIAVLSSLFSNVNHYAHIGGLMFGLLLGLMFNPDKLLKKWFFGAIAAFVIIAVLPVFFVQSPEEGDPQAMDTEALNAIEEGNYQDALDMVNQTFAMNNETGLTYYALGSLYQHAGDDEKAEEYYDLSFQVDQQNDVIVKHRMIELRKNQKFDDMRAIMNQYNGDVEDPDLALIIEELDEIE